MKFCEALRIVRSEAVVRLLQHYPVERRRLNPVHVLRATHWLDMLRKISGETSLENVPTLMLQSLRNYTRLPASLSSHSRTQSQRLSMSSSFCTEDQ